MVYAKQVPPEYVCYEVGDLIDLNELRIHIAGNERLNGVDEKFIDKAKTLHNSMWCGYVPEDGELTDANGLAFTKDEVKALRSIVAQTAEQRWADNEEEFIEEYLTAYYGKPYKRMTIHGCCQGDWNHLYAPTDILKGEFDEIQSVYFGLGTELIIHDEESIVEGPEDIVGYSAYSVETDEESLKKLVAEMAGCSPDEVVLYMFEGWERKPKYKIA